MSVNNCYGTPNNVYNNFPGITNDGSLFTSYQPAGQHNLSLKKAANITNDTLTRHPDLRAIFAANDGMALGAVESAYAAGKGKDILIVGVDGNSDAVKSIKSGRLNASVAQLPYLVGKRSVIGATASLNGLKMEKLQIVTTLVLTKDIIEKNQHPLMQFVR